MTPPRRRLLRFPPGEFFVNLVEPQQGQAPLWRGVPLREYEHRDWVGSRLARSALVTDADAAFLALHGVDVEDERETEDAHAQSLR